MAKKIKPVAPVRPTRKARRSQQGAAARTKQAAASRPRRLPTIGTIIGVLLTVGVLGVILVKTLTSTNSVSTSGGLTDAQALNPAPRMLPTNSVAPNFTLRDGGGKSYTLALQRGHPVLLEFFAVWCPICQGEAPIVAHLAKTYVPKGVRVWSVLANPYGKYYEDSGETDLRLANKGDLAWFARTFKVEHPQLVDATFRVVNQYGINAYPGLYVIDPRGRIVYAFAGHPSYQTLAAQLDKALKTAA